MGEWVVNSVHIIYIYMSFIYSINIWLVFHKNKCIYIYLFAVLCCLGLLNFPMGPSLRSDPS